MEKLYDLSKTLFQRRFVRYFMVGGTTFAIDIGLFSLFHGLLGWDILVANTISYWTAIGFNFWANRNWTFKANDVDLTRNLTLYISLLLFNFAFSSIFLTVATGLGANPQLAKIAATGLQILWTYIAYKKVIFR